MREEFVIDRLNVSFDEHQLNLTFIISFKMKRVFCLQLSCCNKIKELI